MLFMLLLLCLFVFQLNLAWSWAQSLNKHQKRVSFTEIISTAAIEWGAILSLIGCHLFPPKRFFEAPPITNSDAAPQQLPVIFVPSLHTGSGVFRFLIWRLQQNFWNSLWPFSWKSFLNNPLLLEDQLLNFIEEVIEKTGAQRFRIISFGSSRPIIAQVLNQKGLSAYCDRWIAVSSPQFLSEALQLLHTKKLKDVYQRQDRDSEKNPNLLIVGENDLICYPSQVWDCEKIITLPRVGHYGAVLHSATTRSILRELSL